MRVIHLFSNCKWTGPAEPALNLALSLKALGVDIEFACAPDAGKSVNMVVETARARGIEPRRELHLLKHPDFFHTWPDRLRLLTMLKRERFDLVHCHLTGDHNIAAWAAARAGVPLVRSSYEGAGLRPYWRNRRLLRACRFLLQPSRKACQHDHQVFNFPLENMAIVPGAIDTMRFDPAQAQADARARLGLPPDALVLGIVARMQTHRNYEVLFEAIAGLLPTIPNLYLIVVGRGTHQETVGFRPVHALGLEERVHFTGYVAGDEYTSVLSAFDIGIFLVPGSDGTCRAVREILAMGKPVVAADRGMLAEIVTHEHDGLIFDGSAAALQEALSRLLGESALRQRMSMAARETATTRYALDVQARQVLDIYEEILATTRNQS